MTGGRVVHQTATSCCCEHGPEVHLGGPDLTAEGLEALHLTHPGGDGGMCRAHVGGGRCNCFNFCDCHVIVKQIRAELAEDAAVSL
jgi:hypothetical protein